MDGPQLHDGPSGPTCFPPEFDDSLSKRVANEMKGPQLHDGPSGPPCFPSEFDDSLTKRVENDVKRNLLDNPRDGALTVDSVVGTSATNAAAAVGPSIVEGVEEENVSSRGAPPPARSQTEAVATTATAGLTSTSSGRSTVVVEAYRVEEAEETPGIGTVYAEVAVVPFYLRKGFVSIMIAVTLIAIGVAVVAVVLPSNNMGGNTGGMNTSSDGSLTTSVASSDPTKTPTSKPTSNVSQEGSENNQGLPILLVEASNYPSFAFLQPTNIPTNLPTRHQFAWTLELRTAIREYLGQGCPSDANCQARSDYGGAVSPL